MPVYSYKPDPRYFQIFFQLIFLSYGIFFLKWESSFVHDAVSIGACILVSFAAESIRLQRFLPVFGKCGWNQWGCSVLISALSLCLLLKTSDWRISLLAAVVTVLSKYLFRIGGRHIFNPSAFGIGIALLTGKAWLSPGQWGNNIVFFFLIVLLGAIIVTSVQKLDTSMAFLFTYCGLLFWRQILVLGWPLDYFLHSVNTGSLLLFSFFMISDPKTSPNHPATRIIWSILIAALAFYFTAFKYQYNMPVWMLLAASPLVPLLNRIYRHDAFQWTNTGFTFRFFHSLKKKIMNCYFKKISAAVMLVALISHDARAFCGFYVCKAGGTLKNKTSQVILVRDGNLNTITMLNDFHGDMKDFAMVVPVPVVLKKSDIKLVDQQIFNTLDEYSQPRLVEYYDENPCDMAFEESSIKQSAPSANGFVKKDKLGSAMLQDHGVKIEAKYLVGEYDILILSAEQSAGLRTWLIENGYKIPDKAEEVLEPYVKSNLKFFVVKVNEQEKMKLPGNFLRPIQISFNSDRFMLPIRLGMANADGDQDMIVYAFSKKGRIETTNYRTVAMPTGKNIPLFVANGFSNFYFNLFQYQSQQEGQSVAMMEHAWDLSPQNGLKCDPCVATPPSPQDLVQAGVHWLNSGYAKTPADLRNDSYTAYYNDPSKVYFTRLHIRYNRESFPEDLQFQETSNTENFQTRYIITHPATGNLSCAAGAKYMVDLKQRRREELKNLSLLTGKGYSDWDLVSFNEEDRKMTDSVAYVNINVSAGTIRSGNRPILLAGLGLLGIVGLATRLGRRKPDGEKKNAEKAG